MFMTLANNNLLNVFSAVLFSAAISGCATVPGERDPRDPWEPMNRSVFKFNEAADKAVLKPVAKAYRFVAPKFVRVGVTNFFSNIHDVSIFINDIFQGKGQKAVAGFGRVVINTTFGLGGLIDVAGAAGNLKQNEDFGQTLGWYGVRPGPYWTLPLLGPSTVRDAGGRVVDNFLTPTTYLINQFDVSLGLNALEAVSLRSSLLETEKVLDEAGAVDRYSFLRDAFLQRREVLILDGNRPKKNGDDDEEIIFDDEIDAGKAAQPAPKK
jgi:phospholipid-binding lipoprotein MlaA